MGYIRSEALKITQDRKPVTITEPAERRSEIYSTNVFNDAAMSHFMTKDAYNAVMDAINHGKKNR